MKHTVRWIAVWLALLLVASTVSADKRAEQQIRAEYNKIIRYTKQKNVDGLLRQMTPDFLYKTKSGQVLSKQMVEMLMREQYARTQSVDKRTTTIKKMEIKGNTARVTTAEESVVTMVGAQGRIQKVRNVATTRDTWVKTPQGWKIKMTEILNDETFIDGKRQPGN
ncbi:MAG: nuclear transport factor 2 family protein [Armatimonadota bacterium]